MTFSSDRRSFVQNILKVAFNLIIPHGYSQSTAFKQAIDTVTHYAHRSMNRTQTKHTHTQQVSATPVLTRDKEDYAKLAKGIKLAIDKGVVAASVTMEATTKIDVIGKTADQVADEIVKKLEQGSVSGLRRAPRFERNWKGYDREKVEGVTSESYDVE